MKAEIRPTETRNDWYVQIEGSEGIQLLMTVTDKETAQKRADMFNQSLSQHVQSEQAKTNAGYWKERCLVAEDYITQIACAEDIYPEQRAAYGKWKTRVNTPEPQSELSAKIAEIEREFSDDNIDSNYDWIFRDNLKFMRDEILTRLKEKL